MKFNRIKIIGYSLTLLAALTCRSVLASSYYASLTTLPADGCNGMGKVYASTSGTEDSSKYSETGNGAVDSSSTKTSGGEVTMYAWAKANEGYEFQGWSTAKSGATTFDSTAAKYQLTLNASTSDDGRNPYTYYAYFREKTLSAYSITFTTPAAGYSYTVDGAAPANLTGLTKVKKVTLKSDDASFLNWKINGTKVETNPYELSCTADTTVEAEFLTPDKVATVTTKDELAAALANTSILKVQIPSGTSITIPSGTSLAVPSEQTITVDGQLLIQGTLTNNGKINGAGSFSINFYEITQGDVITPANSFTTYPAYRYCKTTVSKLSSGTFSGSGTTTCAKKGAVRIAGSANWTETDSLSPVAAVCSVNTSTAINAYSTVDNAYDSLAAAFEAANPNHSNPAPANKYVVLFANSSISMSNLTGQNGKWSSDGKQISAGFRVDCATYTFTISSKTCAQIYIVNGTTITQNNGDSAYNNHNKVYIVGCTGTATVRINANSGASSRVELYDCANFGVSNNGSGNLLNETNGGGYYLYSGGPYSLSTKTNVRTIGGTYSADPSSQCLAGFKGRQVSGSSSYEVVKNEVAYSFFVDDETVAANQFTTLADAIAGANGQKVIKVAKDLAFASDQTVGSKAVLDLNGFAISGSGKLTVSSAGDLTIIDTSATTTGTFAPALDVSGMLSIAYGTYTGALTLRSGSTTATYAGTFDGAVTVNSGATASFRGGRFKTSLVSYLTTGYHQYSVGGYYCVGKDLGAKLTKKGGSSSLDEQYEVEPIGDSTLYSTYTASAPAFSVGSPSAYFTHAEAVAAISPLNGLSLDLVVRSDRTLAADTLSFKGTLKGISKSATFPTEIPANADYRVLKYYMEEVVGASLIKLARFYDEVGTKLDSALYNDSSATANKGAVCAVELCLFDGNSDKIVLVSSQFTLGARNNVASVSRTGTYYSSLSGAVSAASAGDTVVLTRESSASVTVSKALTIDTKGFALSGVTAGSGYKLTQEGNVVTIAVKQVVPEVIEWNGSVKTDTSAYIDEISGQVTVTYTGANALKAGTYPVIDAGTKGQTYAINWNGKTPPSYYDVTTKVEDGVVKVTLAVNNSTIAWTTAGGTDISAYIAEITSAITLKYTGASEPAAGKYLVQTLPSGCTKAASDFTITDLPTLTDATYRKASVSVEGSNVYVTISSYPTSFTVTADSPIALGATAGELAPAVSLAFGTAPTQEGSYAVMTVPQGVDLSQKTFTDATVYGEGLKSIVSVRSGTGGNQEVVITVFDNVINWSGVSAEDVSAYIDSMTSPIEVRYVGAEAPSVGAYTIQTIAGSAKTYAASDFTCSYDFAAQSLKGEIAVSEKNAGVQTVTLTVSELAAPIPDEDKGEVPVLIGR